MTKTESKRQPLALLPMLGTEMWERYGFYVLQSLLALFLSIEMGLTNTETYTIVGTFTAIAYITPVIGGLIADKLIGQKLSVLLGCYILLASYLFLGVFYGNIECLYISLSGVAVGTGLLKPNISCLVGTLYKRGDPRRDGGFSIYYAGMAFGILIGTTVPYSLQAAFGWRFTFFTPAFALIFASLIFYFGMKIFKIQDNNPINHNATKIISAIVIAFILGLSAFILLDFPLVALAFFIALAIISVIVVIAIALKEDKIQRGKTLSFLILCFISVLFWMLYFQMFLSLTLFIYNCVEKSFIGIPIQPTYYVALESLGLVIFGPMLSPIFSRFYIKRDALDSWLKFLLSIMFMVLAFLFIVISIKATTPSELISPVWLILAYLSVALAELFLSPVGLSMSTKLVRPQVVGLMMGIFFVSLGIGGYLAGMLAKISSVPEKTDYIHMKMIYLNAFEKYFYIAIAIFVISFLLLAVIKRLNPK